MRLSVVCPSRIGCRSVWLKGTPNGSGLLPSPQTVYATAKILNTEFIELRSHRITYISISLSAYQHQLTSAYMKAFTDSCQLQKSLVMPLSWG